ncbi:MAG: hypothetical protein HFH83_09585 [Lachnospiraceae bacterium]|nr:hypothetical protein [Lachnospiraceae bacterium]
MISEITIATPKPVTMVMASVFNTFLSTAIPRIQPHSATGAVRKALSVWS